MPGTTKRRPARPIGDGSGAAGRSMEGAMSNHTAGAARRRGGAATAEATEMLYPLRFEPILKRLIWGGRRLGTLLGKPLGDGHDWAEGLEGADHRADVSR